MRILGMTLTVVLYFAIVFFSVVLLATVQLRSSGGAAFDTWRLNYDANALLAEKQEKVLKSTWEEAAQNSLNLSFVQSCFRLFDSTGVPLAGIISAETAQEVDRAKKDHVRLENLTGDVRCLVQGFSSLQTDRTWEEMLAKNYQDEIEELKKSVSANRDQQTELIQGHQDFVAFRSMASVWYQKLFFTTPYDLLVLLMVMMMGAIGGMVRLLRDYGSSLYPDPSARDYLVIPLIGSVVAIGGYVLAKTGLLLLSSTQGETSLSPYMIGLVGIISGLLAKEVIATIEASGRNILVRSAAGQKQNSGQIAAEARVADPQGGAVGETSS